MSKSQLDVIIEVTGLEIRSLYILVLLKTYSQLDDFDSVALSQPWEEGKTSSEILYVAKNKNQDWFEDI